MAFVIVPQVLTDNLRVDVLSNGREHIVRAHIGDDVHEDVVYSAVVVLIVQPYLPEGQMELMFGVVAAHGNRQQSEWISDGERTKGFLVGDDRKAVLSCICSMAVEVARSAQPSAISFVTSVPYLPQRALTKYGHICKALRDAGYYGGRGDSFNGSEIWMLKRRDG